MKKLWEKVKDKKYTKVVLVVLMVVFVIWLFYILFVRGILEFQNNEKAFLNGTKKYLDYNSSLLPKKDSFKEISLKDLYEAGWVESLRIPNTNRLCSEKSFVRVLNHDGEYQYITYLDCGKYKSKVDHEGPSIVLEGDNTVIVPLNTSYQDAGVREVKDNKDKIDTSKVEVDSSRVNTSQVGTYEVTYKVYDSAYNVGRATRAVVVAETLGARIQRDKGNHYVYTGAADDNYVMFSGMLWRIVKMDQDGNLQLITDNNIANVSYGSSEKSYAESNVYKWLNEYFLSNIHENSRKYLVDTKWCYDDQESIGIIDTCEKNVTAKVGLLSLSDYEKAKVNNTSYLVMPASFSLINRQNFNNVWITDLYNNERAATRSNADLVGVRPVITVNKDTYVTMGEGTLDSPYKLQDYTYGKENEMLHTRLIGEYVVYSGYNFRIAGRDEDGNVKLVAVDLLKNSAEGNVVSAYYEEGSDLTPDVKKNGNLYYALNTDVLNYISEKSLISHEFQIPEYKSSVDYSDYDMKTITSKLSIPASFEMFAGFNKNSNEQQIYWLSDYQGNDMVSILNGNNGLAFHMDKSTFPSNGVKAVIYLDKDIKIASGKGSASDPYYVR